MEPLAHASQRGVALLATLIAITLITVTIVDFTAATRLGSRVASNQANELRAAYLARSGVQIGLSLLAQDTRLVARRPQPFDALTDIWAVPFPPITVDGGAVGFKIEDETGKLSINQLVNPVTGVLNLPFMSVLSALLAELNLPRELLGALVDWLDRDSVPSVNGAEADFYLGLTPPYEPRNGPMPTIADLRMVRGVNDAVFQTLRQFLTAAPTTQVNVNTAPPQVLAATLAGLGADPSLAAAIAETRLAQPFVNPMQLAQLIPNAGALAGQGPPSAGPPGVGGFGQSGAVFTTQSSFFSITGFGTYSGTRKFVYAMVARNGLGPLILNGWHEE
jgi:general secretion pathway protein K